MRPRSTDTCTRSLMASPAASARPTISRNARAGEQHKLDAADKSGVGLHRQQHTRRGWRHVRALICCPGRVCMPPDPYYPRYEASLGS